MNYPQPEYYYRHMIDHLACSLLARSLSLSLSLSILVKHSALIFLSFFSFIFISMSDSLLFFVLRSAFIYTNMTRKHEYGEFKQRNFYIFLMFLFLVSQYTVSSLVIFFAVGCIYAFDIDM